MATTPTPAAKPNELPEQFGPYRIKKRLGQGGMGTVYLAHDTRLNRPVALKVCHLADNAQAMERFKREAQAAAALRHPNLCPVYDCDAIDGVSYFTMAFIEGPTLDKWIAKRGGVTQKEAAILIRKLALALSAAHKAGVIHRDLKPDNVVLDKGGEPVILDFGLARQSGGKEQRLTQDGAFLGTPSYMAPEQVGGDPNAMSASCDIYSLGVMMYELLTGQLPFEGDLRALIGQILFKEPTPPRAIKADVEERLEAICLKAMAKQVEERWESMGEMGKAVTEWLKEGSATATVPPPVSPAQRTAMVYSRSYAAQAGPIEAATIFAEDPTPASKRARRGRKRGRGLPLALIAACVPLLLIGAVGLTWLLMRGSSSVTPVETQTKDGGKKTEKVAPAAAAELPREFTNSIGMKFVLIPPGRFMMGSPPEEEGRAIHGQSLDETLRAVQIEKAFYLGAFEVTTKQFREFATATNFRTEAERNQAAIVFDGNTWVRRNDRNWKAPGFEQTDEHPATFIAWDDAVAFCDWLSAKEGQRFRLPMEAEWEYACRDGSRTRFALGDHPISMQGIANIADRTAKKRFPGINGTADVEDGFVFTAPVGSFKPNKLGLHDMHGNVYEWCRGIKNEHVLRGGSWASDPSTCRAAARTTSLNPLPGDTSGFRVVAEAAPRAEAGGSAGTQSLAGQWVAKYANGVIEVWEISAEGMARKRGHNEPFGKLTPTNAGWLLDFGDGKFDRLDRDGDDSKLRTQHFLTAAQLKSNEPLASGTVVRKSVATLSKERESQRQLAGKWLITWRPNNTQWEWELDDQGRFVRGGQGSVVIIDGVMWSNWGHSHVERIRVVNGQMQLEHFTPKNPLSGAPDQMGVGIKQP